LQSNSATYALTSAMHVLRSAKGTMLTTAKDVPRHVAAALKNVEKDGSVIEPFPIF
jgi:formate dehydrogenase assembly factor FdhD